MNSDRNIASKPMRFLPDEQKTDDARVVPKAKPKKKRGRPSLSEEEKERRRVLKEAKKAAKKAAKQAAKKAKDPDEPDEWNVKAFMITLSNIDKRFLDASYKEEAVAIIRAWLPHEPVSLAISCENSENNHLHVHFFCDMVKAKHFTRPFLVRCAKKFGTDAVNLIRYSKKFTCSREEWLVAKWRYVNNLVNDGYDASKGDAKGTIWIENLFVQYLDESCVRDASLTPKERFWQQYTVYGRGFYQQKKLADLKMQTWLAANRDACKRMIAHDYVDRMMEREEADKYKKSAFNIPSGFDAWDPAKQALIIRGPSGVGKTNFACSLYPFVLVVRHMDQLKEYEPGHHKAVLFDDVHFAKLKNVGRDVFLSILSPESRGGCQLDVKYSHAYLPRGLPRLFTTNREVKAEYSDAFYYDVDTAWGPPPLTWGKEDVAMSRRWHVVDVGSDLIRPSQPTIADAFAQ